MLMQRKFKGGCGVAATFPRSTGIHCGGIATGRLTSASLLVTLGFAMCGRNATQKAAVMLMRTNAWTLDASCFAYRYIFETGSVYRESHVRPDAAGAYAEGSNQNPLYTSRALRGGPGYARLACCTFATLARPWPSSVA